MKYHIRVAEKRVEKTLALGVYPDLSLKDARIAAFNAKQQLREGIDPSLRRRTQRYEQAHARAKQFLGLAEQWFNTKQTNWSDSHRARQQRLLFTDLKPLHIMLDRGAIESARRALHVLHQVLDYGCVLGLLHQNSATPLKSTLPHSTPKHYSTPTTPQDYHEVIWH